MPSEKDYILEFNQHMKSDKMPYIIYADTESLIKEIDGYANNPEKSSTTKFGERIPCGYSMSAIWALDNIENKHTSYRGKDCMKTFCTSLRKNAANVINSKKKKMLPFTKKELKLHQNAIECYICGKRSLKKFANDKNYGKVRDHCHFTDKYRDAVHSICNLRFNEPDELPVGFHNGSNYDYYFIIKELAKESEG